jgi:hypothetical protein
VLLLFRSCIVVIPLLLLLFSCCVVFVIAVHLLSVRNFILKNYPQFSNRWQFWEVNF